MLVIVKAVLAVVKLLLLSCGSNHLIMYPSERAYFDSFVSNTFEIAIKKQESNVYLLLHKTQKRRMNRV